jgi:gentisate 1,2-dioxygenase
MSDRSEELAKHNFFDELMALRDQQRERSKGLFIVKGSEIPLESNRHGLMQWYMHPNISDVSLNTKIFYVQHIPAGSKSGRQHHPGGKIFYFWQGRGHTVLDGVNYSWVAGELVQLPLRREGVTYQHFNDSDDEEALILAIEPNFVDSLGLDKGSTYEEIEDSPDYKK